MSWAVDVRVCTSSDNPDKLGPRLSHALMQQPGRSGALLRTKQAGHDFSGHDASIVTPQDVVTYDSEVPSF